MPESVRALILVLLLTVTAASSAEVYRWKDAAGKTVYGDRPPQDQRHTAERLGNPSVQSTTSGGSEAASAEEEARFQEQQRRLLESMERDRVERERLRTQALAEEQKIEELARRCASVREELSYYEGDYRLTQYDADGNSVALDPAQREQNKARLEAFLAQNCDGDS